MSWASDHVIEAMGFEKAPENMALTARFHSLNVFHIQGVRVDETALIFQSSTLNDNVSEIGIGNSINSICKKMLKDKFVDNEEEWQNQKKCRPPYIVVNLGPTKAHTQKLRYFRRDGKTLHTYDTFNQAKSEIRELSDELLPIITTAISCALLEKGRPFPRLLPIDTAVFGITNVGETLLDTRFELSANLSTASGWDTRSIRKALKRVPKISAKIDSKSASFFHLALTEKDLLKKFLYFFLSIEIVTHSSFGTINHELCVSQLSVNRAKPWTKELSFLREVKKWPNLRDRFLWCASFLWTHLKEEDVETFARLKKVRDDIAHGNIREPKATDVEAAQLLAIRLHSSHQF
jgi:hypothetical protein